MSRSFRRFLSCAFVFCLCTLNPSISVADDWPKYRHDLNNSGWTSETGISSANVSTLAQKWKFNTGNTISGSPAVATVNGTSMVFIGSWSGYFYALNAVTGQETWSFKVDSTPYCSACLIASSPAVLNGIVYFGADNGFLYALNAATGALIWKAQLGDPTKGYSIWSSPAVYNGVVYVGVASHGDNPCVIGHVVALNASTGQTVWNFQTIDESSCPGGSNCVGAGVWASPAIDTQFGVLYVGTGNPGSTCSPSTPNAARWPDSVLALNLSNGQLLNYFQAIGNDNADLDFGSSPLLAYTAIENNGVAHFTYYVTEASKNGNVYFLGRGSSGLTGSSSHTTIDGSEIIGSPAAVEVAFGGGHGSAQVGFFVYGTTTGGHYFVTDQPGGVSQTPISTSYSAAAVISDLVFFGADDKAVHAYSRTNGVVGSQLWSFATGGSVYSGPAISNSRIYFGSTDGFLYCVSPNGQ